MSTRISIVLLIAVSLLFGVGIAFKMRGHEKPAVEVAGGTVYDVGTIPADHPLTHAFRLSNPHSFPVGLSIVTTGCECTTASVSAPVIPPHGQADVTLNVKLEDTKEISSGGCFATTHGDQKVETWLLLTGHVGTEQKILNSGQK
ncbi:hypothetical protein CCAX7_59770 [Capsulimonas corticalis]|uniref:Uncharacterized protein n=1 Tax=Capsulimonas corticalis TaxID=2219043 RepID=A0A402CZK8_9BACT|nr:DUF1573 domain-containing protein [Capsulimonas corticalis]BDI33926.1 hypothetical protein CCAX7_59770 [Capsulimonas corticalis]